MILSTDVSATRSLHQDDYTKTLHTWPAIAQRIKYKKGEVVIKFEWRASHDKMIVEMSGCYRDPARFSKMVREHPFLNSFPWDTKCPGFWSICFLNFFFRITSSVHSLSMTHTDRSASEWPALLKWAATGDSSILPWVMSNRWPLILLWSGCPDSPTYWRPHFLHSIK